MSYAHISAEVKMSLLSVRGLSCGYQGAQALFSVEIAIQEGEIVGVIGPNGAGKTTLLRAVSGTLPVPANSLLFEGIDVGTVSVEQRVGLGICHCPEGRHLFPELTVRRNLELGAYLHGWNNTEEKRLQLIYELFPVLGKRESQLAGTLSGGEQQMVAIGRALMGHPRLLLLDEPSVGIAHRLKKEIFDAISKIRDLGTTVLIVEQDATTMLQITDRAYLMESGVARELNSSDDEEIMRAYMGL